MPNTPSEDATLAVVKQLVRALEDKKAEDLRVLDVSAKSTITDYLVLANGNSEPHLRALRIEAEKVLDAAKQPIAGMDSGNYGAGWTVIDAYQIMAHFFTAEQRENYALEKLWKDAVQIDVKTLLEEPKRPVAVRKTAAKKKAVTRAARPTAAKPPAKKKTAAAKKKAAPATAAPAPRKRAAKKTTVE